MAPSTGASLSAGARVGEFAPSLAFGKGGKHDLTVEPVEQVGEVSVENASDIAVRLGGNAAKD